MYWQIKLLPNCNVSVPPALAGGFAAISHPLTQVVLTFVNFSFFHFVNARFPPLAFLYE